MTFSSEELQTLSEETMRASSQNNMAELRCIYKLIEAPDPSGYIMPMGNEWFFVLLTAEQQHALNDEWRFFAILPKQVSFKHKATAKSLFLTNYLSFKPFQNEST